MQSERMQKLLRWGGYLALAFFSFIIFFYQTFPYRRLFEAFSTPFQRQAKLRVQMKSLSPYYLTGVSIQGLNLQRLAPKGIAEINVPQVQARLSILPLIWGSLSASFSAELANGELSGSFSRSRKNQITAQANLEGIQLALLGPTTGRMLKNPNAKPLLEILFAPVFGTLKGNVEIDLVPPEKKSPSGKGKKKVRRFRSNRNGPFDLIRSTGNFKILLRNFSIGPGYFSAGPMGELPVPRLSLGTLNIQAKMDKGIVEFKTFRAFGGDVDLKITGKLQLNNTFRYSIFRGEVHLKIEKDFVKSLKPDSLFKIALSGLPSPKPDGYVKYRIYYPLYRRPDAKPL
ncbi:MAG: type II secretion system protein GspN [Myxococcales bacterium]|nr:type II secretion system protein GspN [Myxococcales bacterium]